MKLFFWGLVLGALLWGRAQAHFKFCGRVHHIVSMGESFNISRLTLHNSLSVPAFVSINKAEIVAQAITLLKQRGNQDLDVLQAYWEEKDSPDQIFACLTSKRLKKKLNFVYAQKISDVSFWVNGRRVNRPI